jgi:hypothetical protein
MTLRVELYQIIISFKNGEGRSAWVVGRGRGRGMRCVGKGQKQIRRGHCWNSNSFIVGNQCLVKMPFSSAVVYGGRFVDDVAKCRRSWHPLVCR